MGSNNSARTMPDISPKTTGPSRWLPWYTNSISILGIIVIVWVCLHLPQDLLGLTVFALLAAIAELTNVELFSNSRSRVSVSSAIGIASIMIFGPLAGAIVHVATGLMTFATTTISSQNDIPGRARASALRRTAFNTSMFVIATAAAGLTYQTAGGTIGNIMLLTNLFPLLAAATVDVVLNLTILIGVISLQTRRSVTQIWNNDFQWAAPIAIAGNVFGAVLALAYEMFRFIGLAVFMLPILATSYSFRLYVAKSRGYVEKLQKMNDELDQINQGLLETLGAVIDADDMYTYGHSTQVAIYAEALAERLNLPEDEKSRIVKAALLHDLGKVAVKDSIMSKPGPLTIEEYNVLKRHPVIGAEIVSRMKGLQDLVDMVRHHHERWDGKGYPDGLQGDDIVMGARILALADALDAMFSDRPYRPPRSYREVMAEVARCSGTQFDPQVADAFFDLAKQKDPDFFRNSATSVEENVQETAMESYGNMERYLKRSMVPDDPV